MVTPPGTGMSGGKRSSFLPVRWKRPLARYWLLGVVAACSTMSCIWPEPPDYREPAQTRPHLLNPIPTNLQVLQVSSGGEPVNFNVKLESEDAGEGLYAVLVLNYLMDGPLSGLEQTGVYVSAGRSDFSIRWPVPSRAPGACEQLTLIIAHLSSFDSEDTFLPTNDEDVDTLTWWVDINGTEETVSTCGGGAS